MSTLYTHLRKYVGHAKALAKTHNYKRSLAFLTPLDAVCTALKGVKSNHDKAVASIIIQHQTNLSKILPHPENKSYQSSYDKLNAIITEAIKAKSL